VHHDLQAPDLAVFFLGFGAQLGLFFSWFGFFAWGFAARPAATLRDIHEGWPLSVDAARVASFGSAIQLDSRPSVAVAHAKTGGFNGSIIHLNSSASTADESTTLVHYLRLLEGDVMAEKKAEVYLQHEHPKPHPNDQPADVFQTMQESEAWVVRGLLVDAGLEAEVLSREAPADVLPGVGGFVVRVPQEDAEEARGLIATREVPGGDDSETAA